MMSRRVRVSSLLAVLLLLPSMRARAADEKSELEALREEVRQERAALAAERAELAEQRRRVDDALAELEHERATRPQPPSTSVGGVEPGLGVTPESPASFQREARPYLDVYGFAQLDAIYDFQRMDLDWKSTLRPSKIPVDCPGDSGCGNNGEATLSAKQSRLGVKAGLPTPLGELFANVEFDLFATGGNAGETNFRLRHAYGELGPVLAGQTNSVFMDGDVFPNVVDYWGPIGMVFLRDPQLRYTPLQNENWQFAMALENPSSALDEGKISQVAPELNVDSWNPSPDYTTHLRFSGPWGHAQAAAIFRVLGFQTTNVPGNNPDGTEFGWGINLSSAIHTFGDDQLLLQVVYGDGIASYMNDGGVDLAPANKSLTHAEAVPLLGWLAYYNHTWNDRWTSSVGFSENRQWTTSGQEDSAFETGQYASANLLFHPVPEMLIGPEFLWGRRENRNNDSESDNRIQLSVKYDFSGRIFGGQSER
jgi:outer membrane DcaP-like protein